MGKKKISKRRERSSQTGKKAQTTKLKKLKRVEPLKYLTSEKKAGEAILECLQNNDPEGVMEVVGIYLDALNKSKLIKSGEIPKSTFYDSLRHRNPTLKTFAKLISSYTHSE